MLENHRNNDVNDLEAVIAHALHPPPPWIREEKEIRPSPYLEPVPNTPKLNDQKSVVENKTCAKTIWSHCKCLRVGLIFIAVIAVIIIVHQEATHSGSSEVAKASKSFRQIYPNATGDLWLNIPDYNYWTVLENVSNHLDSACAVIHAAQYADWKVLVLEDNLPGCCLFDTCIHLPSSWLRQKARYYAMTLHFSEPSARKALYRNVAFLHTLYHGAVYVFDVSLSELDAWGCPLKHKECEEILASELLQVTTKRKRKSLIYTAPYTQRIYEPMQHFGCSDCWPKGYDPLHQGKVFNDYFLCQSPEPLVIKLYPLDRVLDSTAPSVTIPPGIFSPFLTSNTIYNRQALWSTLIFPDIPMSTALLLRSFWMHAIFDRFGDYIRFSGLPALKTETEDSWRNNHSEMIHHEPSLKFFEKSAELTVFLLQWVCGANELLVCILQLGHDLHYSKYISSSELTFLHSWVDDLRKVNHPQHWALRTKASNSKRNPCKGDSPSHVHFYPSYPTWVFNDSYQEKWQKNFHLAVNQYLSEDSNKEEFKAVEGSFSTPNSTQDQLFIETDELNIVEKSANIASHSDTHKDHPSHIWDDITLKNPTSHAAYETTDEANLEEIVLEKLYALPLESEGILSEVAGALCPGFEPLFPFMTTKEFRNTLLIIAFHTPNYDDIPYLEMAYRNHYPNILYCGVHDKSIDFFSRKFQQFESRSFSFIPVLEATPSSCLRGAIDMSYSVDNYLMVQWNAVLFPPRLINLPSDKVWMGVIEDPEQALHNSEEVIRTSRETLEHLSTAFGLLRAQISRHHLTNSSRVTRQAAGSAFDFHKFTSADSPQDNSSEVELFEHNATALRSDSNSFSDAIEQIDENDSLTFEGSSIDEFGPIYLEGEDKVNIDGVYDDPSPSSSPLDFLKVTDTPMVVRDNVQLDSVYGRLESLHTHPRGILPLVKYEIAGVGDITGVQQEFQDLKEYVDDINRQLTSEPEVVCSKVLSCRVLLEFGQHVTSSEDNLKAVLAVRSIPIFMLSSKLAQYFLSFHQVLAKSGLTEAQIITLVLSGMVSGDNLLHLSQGKTTRDKQDFMFPFDFRQLTSSSSEVKRSFCIDYLAGIMTT